MSDEQISGSNSFEGGQLKGPALPRIRPTPPPEQLIDNEPVVRDADDGSIIPSAPAKPMEKVPDLEAPRVGYDDPRVRVHLPGHSDSIFSMISSVPMMIGAGVMFMGAALFQTYPKASGTIEFPPPIVGVTFEAQGMMNTGVGVSNQNPSGMTLAHLIQPEMETAVISQAPSASIQGIGGMGSLQYGTGEASDSPGQLLGAGEAAPSEQTVAFFDKTGNINPNSAKAMHDQVASMKETGDFKSAGQMIIDMNKGSMQGHGVAFMQTKQQDSINMDKMINLTSEPPIKTMYPAPDFPPKEESSKVIKTYPVKKIPMYPKPGSGKFARLPPNSEGPCGFTGQCLPKDGPVLMPVSVLPASE